MAIEWCQFDELRDAASHPDGNEDAYNRPLRDIWENYFLVQHDRDGDHMSDLVAASVGDIEETSYAGDGVDPQVVPLTDATQDIKFLFIFYDGGNHAQFRSESMAGDNTKETDNTAFQADRIESIGTGSFNVGGHASVNTNLTEYFYFSIGV